MLATAREAIPELPADRAARFEQEFGLSAPRARSLAFRTELGDYFEAAVAASDGVEPSAIANWIEQLVERVSSDVDPASTKVSAEALAALVDDGEREAGEPRRRP